MRSRRFLKPEQLGIGWRGPGLIAGVDEAGRGPLAGPVVAAAVMLDDLQPIKGLADSKVLSPRRRERLYDEIRAKALCCCVAEASVAGDRPAEHPAGHLAGDAPRGRRAAPAAALRAGRRQPPAGAGHAGACHRQGRCQGAGHRRGVDPGQGAPRPAVPGAAPALPAVRLRCAQGLSHGRAPARAAGARPLRSTPAQLRPGAARWWCRHERRAAAHPLARQPEPGDWCAARLRDPGAYRRDGALLWLEGDHLLRACLARGLPLQQAAADRSRLGAAGPARAGAAGRIACWCCRRRCSRN